MLYFSYSFYLVNILKAHLCKKGKDRAERHDF